MVEVEQRALRALEDDEPSLAQRYVEFVAEALDVAVSLVGTGAEREAVARP